MKKIFFTTIAMVTLTMVAFAQKTETRVASGFTGIDASTAFNITVAKGNAYSVTIVADEELMPYLQSEVKNGVLRLYYKEGYNNKKRGNFKSPEVQITTKDLNAVSLSGACRMECTSTFEPASFTGTLTGATSLVIGLKTGDINFTVSGASSVDLTADAKQADFEFSGSTKSSLQLNVPTAKFGVSGASNATVRGASDYAQFNVSGASKINALQFVVKRAQMNVSGTSKADANVTDQLSVSISGMSTVSYKGSPTFESIETSGMSKIKRID